MLSEGKRSDIPSGSAAASSVFYTAPNWRSCANGLELFACFESECLVPPNTLYPALLEPDKAQALG